MKTAITIVQVLVGVLFIISGLVKANDPLSLSYKMQEFFEIWTTGLQSSGFFLKFAVHVVRSGQLLMKVFRHLVLDVLFEPPMIPEL